MPDSSGPAEVDEGRWRAAGDRIETLLDASATGGAVARERAESLVREVADLYGEGLARILSRLDRESVESLTADELIASLLLVHGLHPHDVRTRVDGAIESVRPYLGSHGGDVRVLGVSDDIVRLELEGSCRSCPSSSVTLELAVQEAIRAAAPEIVSIEVVAAEPAPAGLIPADSLLSRVHEVERPGAQWEPVPELADLKPGEVGGYAVAGLPILVCRLADGFFAYRDHCPVCQNSLAGVVMHSSPQGVAILRCPTCGARFDAVHAGTQLDGDDHLEPLPLLTRDGTLAVAVPSGAVR
ncbi:NifU family protein [Gordonia sp. SL306]|uniref:NifU family protein n=1 Tax=Gordonia sp. SL306 TaxID=2995145 RepID=UPI002270F8C4|nr:NifU family protein [Gordonia sp. SL306]WAC53711.1 NifU family protein [Gordonia sp. SL306]